MIKTYVGNGHGDVKETRLNDARQTDVGLVVRQVTDTNGDTVVKYSYDAWGNHISDTASASQATSFSTAKTLSELNPYRYAGYHYEGPDTGIYYWLCSADDQINNKAYWYRLIEGNWYADNGLFIGNNPLYRASHAHDPDTHESWSSHTEDSGANMTQHYTGVAREYRYSNPSYEMYRLGNALHFLQDSFVPQHTEGGLKAGWNNLWTEDHYHGGYEKWVDLMFQRGYFIPNESGTRGVYSFRRDYYDKSGRRHGNPRSAYGWVDQGAHTSKHDYYRKPIDGEKLSRLTYYYVATNQTNIRGYDNWKWTGTIFSDGELVTTRVGGGKPTYYPADDYWWKTEPLVKASIRYSAGFIYEYYTGYMKGERQWYFDDGYEMFIDGMGNWEFW